MKRCLDLFCCAGGASEGYRRAGFEVTGVDIAPQPNYRAGRFIHADALEFDLSGYDLIHASPPCQRFSSLAALHQNSDYLDKYPDLIEAMRERLKASGKPYVIENVPKAPLLNPVVLCGSAFGLNVWRHRAFESNLLLMGRACLHKQHPAPIDVSGTGGRRINDRAPGGGNSRKPLNLAEARRAMGIDWMNRRELAESIPPAFTEFLGRQIMQQF